MIESSIVIAFFIKIGSWFSNQFENSKIIQKFINQKDMIQISNGSVFGHIFSTISNVFKNIFSALKLNVLLKNSIFTMPFLWALPVIALSPFFPTMILAAMSIFSVSVLLIWSFMDRDNNLKFFTVNKYILIFATVYIYAAFASVARISSIKVALVTVGMVLFYFVAINSIDNIKKFNIAMFIFLSMGVLVSLYGLYQFRFPEKFSGVWVDTDMFEDIGFRVYSTFSNPNVLGEYLLLTIPFGMAYVVKQKQFIKRLIALAVVGIMMLCLLLTYSRGCYIGIILGIGIFLVLLDRRFIWVGVIGIFFLPMIMPASIINRFTSIGNLNDSSTSYRLNIWLGTLSMLKDYWICGTGPGIDAFNQVYPLYSYSGIAAPHSHNLFLQLTCDAGIVGVGSFIAILYKYFRTAFTNLKLYPKNENRVFVIAGIAAILGFAAQSMFDYTFYNYKVVLIFWMTLGFGIASTKLQSISEMDRG